MVSSSLCRLVTDILFPKRSEHTIVSLTYTKISCSFCPSLLTIDYSWFTARSIPFFQVIIVLVLASDMLSANTTLLSAAIIHMKVDLSFHPRA